MSATVWMSGLMLNDKVGMKQGIRVKLYGHDWTPESFVIPAEPDDVYDAYRRYVRGAALAREELPEAGAVWDLKQFRKTEEIFMVGPFYAVRGKIAAILSDADLGEGGLVQFPLFQRDLATPEVEECYFLNFGCSKNTLVIDQCDDAEFLVVNKDSGQRLYNLNSVKPAGTVTLSRKSLEGADLWMEKSANRAIFMKDKLARKIIDAGLGDVFELLECKIVDVSAGAGRVS